MLTNLVLVLDYVKMYPLLFVLFVAAFQDCTRNVTVQVGKENFVCGEVSNQLWLYLPVGFALTIMEVLLLPDLFLYAVGSVVFSIVVAFAIYGVHGWGGADLKAFLTIAFSMPIFPLKSYLFPFPLPFLVLLIACFSGVVYASFKKAKTVRFIPFILFGYVIAILI